MMLMLRRYFDIAADERQTCRCLPCRHMLIFFFAADVDAAFDVADDIAFERCFFAYDA